MNGVPSSAPDVSSEQNDSSDQTDRSVTDRLRDLVAAVTRRLRGHEDASADDGARDQPSQESATFDLDREGYPDRDRPLTYPGRDSDGVNTTDVVGVETDDGLRLSVPENPDAEVVSDVWVPIEE
jgi:hypothetical protein